MAKSVFEQIGTPDAFAIPSTPPFNDPQTTTAPPLERGKSRLSKAAKAFFLMNPFTAPIVLGAEGAEIAIDKAQEAGEALGNFFIRALYVFLGLILITFAVAALTFGPGAIRGAREGLAEGVKEGLSE